MSDVINHFVFIVVLVKNERPLHVSVLIHQSVYLFKYSLRFLKELVVLPFTFLLVFE